MRATGGGEWGIERSEERLVSLGEEKSVRRLWPHYYLPLHAWCHPANPEEYTLAMGHTYGRWKHICTSFCPLTNSEVSLIIPLPLIEIAMQIPFIKSDMDNFSMLHGDTIIFRAHGAGCKVSSDIQMACLFNCSKCSMSRQFGGGNGVHSWTFLRIFSKPWLLVNAY